MNKKLNLLDMLDSLLVLSLVFIGCLTTGAANSGTATKFEGKWVNPDAINDFGYSDFSFTFTGNKMLFKSSGNGNDAPMSRSGTFTFTNTEITFIPERENTWKGYKQKYTLQDDVLMLERAGNGNPFGPFEKQ
jgi:hypothetical protein